MPDYNYGAVPVGVVRVTHEVVAKRLRADEGFCTERGAELAHWTPDELLLVLDGLLAVSQQADAKAACAAAELRREYLRGMGINEMPFQLREVACICGGMEFEEETHGWQVRRGRLVLAGAQVELVSDETDVFIADDGAKEIVCANCGEAL